MKYIKMLGLAAIAAMALMAVVGASTASATELYLNGAKYSGNLDFSLEPGTKADLVDTELEPVDTCEESTVKGKTTVTGSATTTVTGEITALTWGKCTFTTDTTQLGKLEIHNIAGTTDGTLTSDSEIKVTINTFFFGSCVYGVKAGTDLGRLTEGNPATFHANAVAIELSSNFACPDTSLWTAKYVATEPTGTLEVRAS